MWIADIDLFLGDQVTLDDTALRKCQGGPRRGRSVIRHCGVLDSLCKNRTYSPAKEFFQLMRSLEPNRWRPHMPPQNSPTNASRTLLPSLKTLTLSKPLLNFFSLCRSILPKLVPSCEIYGEVVFGPLKGVPIGGLIGD